VTEVKVTTVRPGNYVVVDGNISEVVEYQHVKPGKGGAFVRLKVKNAQNGAVLEKTLDADAKIKTVEVMDHAAQFLFRSGDRVTFMNLESFEQIEMPVSALGGREGFLKNELEVKLEDCEGKILGIKFPTTVELKVQETPPGVKGDTVTRGTKPATLETGFVVNVPLFINTGDMIRLDTRSGEYVERV
jgi:elongation factor P